jgi:integrase
MISLSDGIDAYLVLRCAKHKPSTTRCDRNDLRRLLAYVGNVRLKDLNKDHLVGYFYGAKGRVNQVSAATFNAERGRIITFLHWAVEEGHIAKSPMRGIDRRTVRTRERLRLNPDQMLEAIAGEEYPRDRALLSVVCNTALRAHAITLLRVRDVDLANGYLCTYTTKTETERLMPMPSELEAELRSWREVYAQECGPLHPDWFLLPARARYGWYTDPTTGRRDDNKSVLRPTVEMCYQTTLRIVHKTLARLGLDGPGEGLHTLRRSSARAVFDAVADDGDARAIHIAREFLGHTNVAMTEHYIGTSHERKQLDDRMKGKAFLAASRPESSNVVDLAALRRRKRG